MADEPLSDSDEPTDPLDLYTIGGHVPISGEWARQIERGEPIVLWVGGFEDDDGTWRQLTILDDEEHDGSRA